MNHQGARLPLQFDIGALFTLALLHLLVHARADLSGDDFIPAVAFTGPRGWLDDVFVTGHLCVGGWDMDVVWG